MAVTSSQGIVRSKTIRFCSTAGGCAILAWARGGAAQTIEGLEVRWTAPEGCPASEDLQARVRLLLGADAARPQRGGLVVAGTVTRADGRYRLSLEVVEERQRVGGPRVFESDSCDSLAGAAAVTVALLVRGRAGAHESDRHESDRHESDRHDADKHDVDRRDADRRDADKDGASPPARPARPEPKRGALVLVAPLLALDKGVLPSPALGGGIGAGLRVNGFEMVLSAVLWAPRDDGGGSANRFTARYVRRTGELTTCYGWGRGPLDLGPCVRLSLEDVQAEGAGPEVVGAQDRVDWLTIGIAALARWSPSPWVAFFLRPRLSFSTSQPIFNIDGIGALHQVPPVAVGLDGGCMWIL